MAEERIITTHIKASIEYLEAARKLIEAGEYSAAVLCTTTGMERAAMALVLHLGARPATRHRHHEVLKTLQPLVKEECKREYQEVVEAVAELMGHLTMVRYKYEVAGEYKTPKEIYDKGITQQLYKKAEKTLAFIKNYTSLTQERRESNTK